MNKQVQDYLINMLNKVRSRTGGAWSIDCFDRTDVDTVYALVQQNKELPKHFYIVNSTIYLES
jgi:hypothetical protein